jgi:tetratricopeptide (TPR) repeat protein
MEAVRIEADPAGVLPGRFWDSYTLFEQAGRAFDAKDYARAEVLYARVPAEFAESDLVAPARFNRGLCLESLGRYAEAEGAYEAVLGAQAGAIAIEDVLFRVAACQEAQGNWDAAARTYGVRLAALTLPPIREAEARVRLGAAQFQLGRLDEAAAALRAGLAAFRALRLHPVRLPEEVIGQGYFTLGEIQYARFAAVSLDVPEERQGEALETKSELFLAARAQYVQAIRSYDATWMTAALCRIGQGYEAIFLAARDAPLPPGLTPAEAAEYKKKLDAAMDPARRNAVAAHRRNVEFATSRGIDNEWTRTSRDRLAALSTE